MKTDVAGCDLAELTAGLQGKIPMARQMGIEVVRWDHRSVTLGAPLAPNINHTETAFGGSISSLAILAGYALLDLAIKDRGISTRVLIQKSATDFRRPIDGPMTATAGLPGEEAVAEFVATLEKKRKARMTVESQVLCGQAVAAVHVGVYVAIVY